MTEAGSSKADPSAIKIIPEPPFVRLPDPSSIFAARAARFRRLAEGHDLAPYLRFLAGIAEIQADLQNSLPRAEPPGRDATDRAARHAMPPLDRLGFVPGREIAELIDRLTAEAGRLDMPLAAHAALDRLASASEAERNAMVADVLADAIPFEAIAEHALVAAALQVHFARLAAELEPDTLKPVGDGACPACGGPPATSLVVDLPRLEGPRYCACALCGTLWNYVRAKCTLCGSTKSISFREVAGGDGEVKAEVCGVCNGYVKVLYQQKNPNLDPVADDVATLALDILVRDLGIRRGGVNPFLVGY